MSQVQLDDTLREWRESAKYWARHSATIRQMFADDLEVNRLGVGAHRREGTIHYAYPVAVVVGQKQPPT